MIAVEPYTQTTDAINLAARGVDGGLRVLGHGKTETIDDRHGDGRLRPAGSRAESPTVAWSAGADVL